MISLQAIWDDTTSFIKREQSLLVPLALATLGIGNMGLLLAADIQPAHVNDAIGIGLSAATLVLTLWILLGHLAITTLVLRGGMSVGEAMRHGASCLWRVLVVQVLVGMMLGILLFPVLYKYLPEIATMSLAHIHPTGGTLLWTALVLCIGIWLSVRILPIQPLQVDQKIGISDAIRKAFALTHDHFLPLLGLVILMGLLVGVMQLTSKFVLGSVFTIIGKALESPFTGKVLEGLTQSALSTIVGLVSAVFVAKLYQKLSGRSASLNSIFG
jgi:membrane-anchored glycerophosphoryl diester phosphodiesterase (GDPDase)